ncbi:protein kinase domain-containing protein [Aquisphaera insulae]|uniref:protein kinase domain-containing protein n=1 Tax=Aquisphaera insulae TaxID=2712864 RepID=UPI0013E9BE87|nr:protein kinase [Aquisphaera insulae]
MNDFTSDRDPFEVVAESFLARYRAGERPSIDELADRHPELAGQIRRLLPAMVRVEDDLTIDPEPGPAARAMPRASPGPSRQLGDYRILGEIGRGGMGTVYEAEQVSLGRRVALKVLPGHAVGDRSAEDRFRREAKAAARLHHTNIVPVFEVGREGDVDYYAMQLIAGQGLDQVIEELKRLREPDRGPRSVGPGPAHATTSKVAAARARSLIAESLLGGRLATEGPGSLVREVHEADDPAPAERLGPDATLGPEPPWPDGDGPPAWRPTDPSSSAVLPGGTHASEVDTSGHRRPFFRSVAQIGRQVAQGLAYAHARGVVHRDIKPSNLLLDTAAVVWITDFGLAKAEEDGLTATGDILGTLRYMPPERFRGEGDARADIYALGMTLYELLTLRPAFSSSDRLKLIEQIKNEEPTRPRSLDSRIPRDLETIVLKALDKLPERRYPTAEAMAEDLRRFLADEPIKARKISTSERYWRWARRNPVVAALGGVLTAVLVMFTIGSFLTAVQFADLARRQGDSAAAERSARREADQARATAETARVAAQAETYRAVLSEVKALRAGHPPGWRDDALGSLAQLTTMPTPGRDLVELRNEAVASLVESDVVEVARLEGHRSSIFSLDFSPDSRALATASHNGDLHVWDVARRQHAWLVPDPAGKIREFGWPAAGDPSIQARFLPDGGLARIAWDRRVEFLDSSGRPSARPPIGGGKAQAVGLEVDRRGRWLAVGWDDGRVELRDAATGALRRSIRDNPRSFALSPDGRWIAFAGPNDAVRIHPTDADGPPMTLGRQRGRIRSLTFSPDGTTLGVASQDHTATLWDVARREEQVTLRGHKEAVVDIAFSPDGNWVATASTDFTTRIWDVRNGQTLAVLPAPGANHSVAFSPDGHFLAVSTSAATGRLVVSLYQIQGRRERRLLVGHRNGTQFLAFHPRSARLASGADDHDVIVWDAESARPLRRWSAHTSYVTTLAFSPDGSLLATGCGGDDVRLWDAENGAPRHVLPGHRAAVRAIAFDPTGRRLATGDTSGVLLIWDVGTGQLLRRETVGPSWIWSIAFVDGGRRLVTEVTSGPLVVFDLEGTDPPRRVAVPGGMFRFVVDRARDELIVTGDDANLSRISLRDFAVVRHIRKGHEDGGIQSLALQPGGRLLATGGGVDRKIILRDAATLEPLATLLGWTGIIKDLAFDSTGRWLAITGASSDVGLWDLGLIRDELAAVGLAWDQAVPPVASTTGLAPAGERTRPPIPVIRPGAVGPAEFEKARGLVQSGVVAYQQGRLADAVVDLQQAGERLQALRRSRPADPLLARLHGTSLGVLAGSLRDLKRPGEALARFRESLAAYESLGDPNPGDLYNMARVVAMVSALDGRLSPEDRERLEARAVGYLRRTIEAGQPRIVPMIPHDHDLDPLRDRTDFRAMMTDAGFPRDPFAR